MTAINVRVQKEENSSHLEIGTLSLRSTAPLEFPSFHCIFSFVRLYKRYVWKNPQASSVNMKTLIKRNIDIYLVKACTMSPIRQILALQFYSLQPVIQSLR